MVKLSELKAPKDKKVRHTVKSPTGIIRIFEPTVEDYNAILGIQKEHGIQDGDTVEFAGRVVIQNIFPVLTDIDTNSLTDEDIEDILDNPSIHLLTVQNFVSQIITEINTLFVQRIKTELEQANAVVEQTELISIIPRLMKTQSRATNNEKALGGLDKIQQVGQQLEGKVKGKLSVVDTNTAKADKDESIEESEETGVQG